MSDDTPVPPTPPLTLPQQALVTKHAAIAERAAAGFASRFGRLIEEGDLRGFAHVGLVDAARRYDPKLEVPFDIFATAKTRWAIWSGIRRELPQLRFLAAAARAACEYLERAPDEDDPFNDTDEMQRQRVDDCQDGVMTAMLVGYAGQARRDPAELAARAQLLRGLQGAIDQLTPRQREVLRMHYDEDLPLAEVAVQLSVHYATAKRDHREAIDELAKRLRAAGLIEAKAA